MELEDGGGRKSRPQQSREKVVRRRKETKRRASRKQNRNLFKDLFLAWGMIMSLGQGTLIQAARGGLRLSCFDVVLVLWCCGVDRARGSY